MTTNLLKNHRLPVQIEGFPYIFGGLTLALASAILWRGSMVEPTVGGSQILAGSMTVLFSVFTAFSIWFYRNPNRPMLPESEDPNAVISPADGRVLFVDEVDGARIGAPRAKRVAIFMSPVDVHVNRAPITGTIEKVEYVKGKFFKADLPKASDENEHNWVVIKNQKGLKIAFNQIAGFVARRIVCYVEEGQFLSRGERYGMIRFGSRMEVLFPVNTEILVQKDDRTVAGVTKLGRAGS